MRTARDAERPEIATARVVVLVGAIDDETFAKIKDYYINAVESREASLQKPETLNMRAEVPARCRRCLRISMKRRRDDQGSEVARFPVAPVQIAGELLHEAVLGLLVKIRIAHGAGIAERVVCAARLVRALLSRRRIFDLVLLHNLKVRINFVAVIAGAAVVLTE